MNELFKELKKRRVNKYRNKKVKWMGEWYQSKLEMCMAQELFFRLKANDIIRYERQVPFTLTVKGDKIAIYKVDFLVYHREGPLEVIECKGVMTSDARLKIKLFKVLYPEYKFTLIKEDHFKRR